MRLGYCCINLTLADQGISANRGMIKKTFQEKGLTRAGELSLLNLQDLFKILQWNVENNIKVYRMSSDIFPWMSEYKFSDLPQYYDILNLCKTIGDYIKLNGLRVSFHPGQFDVLASPNKSVVEKTIYDLDQHSRIMNMMGLVEDHYSAINIHIGGSYGDKKSALDRFCTNFKLLEDHTRARLVVENDDKESQYSVNDLYFRVYSQIGTPITFDHFHHLLCTGGVSSDIAANTAASTWGNLVPLQHYSSSKKLNEDSSVVSRSHADWIWEKIPTYDINADIELEVKMKDLALLKYLKQFN